MWGFYTCQPPTLRSLPGCIVSKSLWTEWVIQLSTELRVALFVLNDGLFKDKCTRADDKGAKEICIWPRNCDWQAYLTSEEHPTRQIYGLQPGVISWTVTTCWVKATRHRHGINGILHPGKGSWLTLPSYQRCEASFVFRIYSLHQLGFHNRTSNMKASWATSQDEDSF